MPALLPTQAHIPLQGPSLGADWTVLEASSQQSYDSSKIVATTPIDFGCICSLLIWSSQADALDPLSEVNYQGHFGEHLYH